MTYSFSEFKGIGGVHIELLPLTQDLIAPLTETLFSPHTFFVAKRGYNTKEIVTQQIQNRLNDQRANLSLTVVATDKKSGKLAAMSSYLFPSPKFTKVEIGFTWIADPYLRSYVNTEMKLLMLRYAFEVMGVKRVEFSIDTENLNSQNAIKRIGATYEGTLRKWRFNTATDHGNRCMFSIIDEEWPQIQQNLHAKIRA